MSNSTVITADIDRHPSSRQRPQLNFISNLSDPDLIERIVRYRADRLGGDGHDEMDEFSNHYALVSDNGAIDAAIMFTRLASNMATMESQLVDPIPENLRPRVAVIGHFVSSGRLSSVVRLVVNAWEVEFNRGARMAMMFVQKRRTRQYTRYGFVPTTHPPVTHPRTGSECFLMLCVSGLIPSNTALHGILNTWPEVDEFELNRDYLEGLGVDTKRFNIEVVENDYHTEKIS